MEVERRYGSRAGLEVEDEKVEDERFISGVTSDLMGVMDQNGPN
jgi:hypothetical protein